MDNIEKTYNRMVVLGIDIDTFISQANVYCKAKNKFANTVYDEPLNSCLFWERTPQGRRYWENLNEQLDNCNLLVPIGVFLKKLEELNEPEPEIVKLIKGL